MSLAQAAVAIAFALVHLFAWRLTFLDVIPRSRWLSMAGGVSVAYVFLHVFPELQQAQQHVANTGILSRLQHHVYLLALLGFAVFYGLERLMKSSPSDPASEARGETRVPRGLFWLHVSSFAVYNALIGYLLVRREDAPRELAFFAMAIGVHLLVNDYGLREQHRRTYTRVGRWLLAASIVAGYALGLAVEFSRVALGALFAFIAGGVVLNVLKEELPAERQSRFSAFALGAAGYSLIVLAE